MSSRKLNYKKNIKLEKYKKKHKFLHYIILNYRLTILKNIDILTLFKIIKNFC